ncbi:MAG: prepilin-type N-terminal cleavage/methylation domain-containing protein [Planctomycetota bacterium]|nr:prepilin-type N-terminal cleavage/methylation domain-containing protein [Planctomycetota bacterium]
MADLRKPRSAPEASGRSRDRRDEAGFTLAEMLAALAILMTGLTTLLLSISDSVAVRRSTDMRLAAAQAVEGVLLQVRETGIRRKADGETDLDLELVTPQTYEVPNQPGLRFHVTAEEHPHRADLWLVRMRATWMDAGEILNEDFLRVVPVQLPMSVRVAQFFEETQSSAR